MATSKNSKSSAAKKKSAAKQQPANNSQKLSPAAKSQRNAIILMAVAVIMLFVAFIEGQSVWKFMHESLYALFGFLTLIVPFYMIYAAFVYAKDKTLRGAAANLVGVGSIIVLLSGVLHIGFANEEYFLENSIIQQIADVWEKAPTLKSGGVFGAVFGGLIAKLFGRLPALITLCILLVVVFLLVTGISLETVFSAIKKPVKKMGEFTSEQLERSAQRREQMAAERDAEAKKKKAFAPPAKPTISADEVEDEEFEDDFVSDETTFVDTVYPYEAEPVIDFIPEAEDFVPEIPVIKLPDSTESSVVEDVIESAINEEKSKAKAPAMPDGDPFDEEDDDDIKEFPVIEEAPEYVFPPIDCLRLAERDGATDNVAEMQIGAKKLISTLESFKIKAEVTNICRGPSVTRYELVPDAGVRINKITNLSDDIALRLAATSVRIEAPIPGKSAIGIEVPNSAKSMVTMRETIDTPQFRDSKSKLNVALGKDITGNIICADLAKMPHLLVAGTTGSGKSVCLNAMIVSLLYNASPDEVKLLMIDPKMVEFTNYNGIAHLEVPVVSNPRKAAGALGWAVGEMEKRYALFAENGIRDIKGFNALCESRPDLKKIPQIVIFIDELADLMMVSPKEVEDSICRLAQKARAAGIHLVIATQRPSVDVITGLIKANIPSRIALSVSSPTDSRIILDAMGAEKLLGNGDMLFCPIGSSKSLRVQGCYISEEEVENVVSFIKSQATTTYNEETIKEIENKAAEAENAKKKVADDDDEGDWDPALNDAIEVVVNAGGASTTMLQKKLKLGYARASRVMDQLEEKGIVGPSEGAKPRAVLISKQQWYEMQALAEGAAPNIDEVFDDDDDYAGFDEF